MTDCPEFVIIGQNLRKYRKARNLRQAELAQLAGLTQSAISNIENARPCELRTLITLSRALQVPLWHMLREDGAEPL